MHGCGCLLASVMLFCFVIFPFGGLRNEHGRLTDGGQSGRTANRHGRGPRPGHKASTQTQPARPTGTQTAQETQDDGKRARPEKNNGNNGRPRQPIKSRDD
jgi:hypothetical protein